MTRDIFKVFVSISNRFSIELILLDNCFDININDFLFVCVCFLLSFHLKANKSIIVKREVFLDVCI